MARDPARAPVRAHLRYLRYLARHKWFVLLGCAKLRVPLRQAILHDWSKFLPVEWGPYVRQFFNPDGSQQKVRDATGAYDPAAQAEEFQRAWLHHQHLRHHWQAWVVVGDGGTLKPLPIPERFVREMVADWYGAGRAISGTKDPTGWYLANRDKLLLHPQTRALVHRVLLEFQPRGEGWLTPVGYAT